MGLDQYVYKVKLDNKEVNSYLKSISDVAETYEEIWYGRKVNPLQGFFEKEYKLENCEYVRVDEDVLDLLSQRINRTLYCISEVLTVFKGVENAEEFKEVVDNLEEDEADDRIHELEELNDEKLLSPEQGFFYGNYEFNYYWLQDIAEIFNFYEQMENQLENLEDDTALYYTCWY